MPGNMGYEHEELYRTEEGEYFVHGEYSRAESRSMGIINIRTLTKDEAYEWMCEHADEEKFPDKDKVEEKEEKK